MTNRGYRIGKSVATNPLHWAVAVAIAVAVFVAANWYASHEKAKLDQQKAEQAKASAARVEAARALNQQRLRERCIDKIEVIKTEARAHLQKNNPADAIKLLNECQGTMTDPAALTTLSQARDAFEKQKAHAERTAAAAEAKRKKSEGVRVGMSKEDVLASSWGKPEKINTTTTASGSREQWVYGSGNYLHFTNGVLTTIQN